MNCLSNNKAHKGIHALSPWFSKCMKWADFSIDPYIHGLVGQTRYHLSSYRIANGVWFRNIHYLKSYPLLECVASDLSEWTRETRALALVDFSESRGLAGLRCIKQCVASKTIKASTFGMPLFSVFILVNANYRVVLLKSKSDWQSLNTCSKSSFIIE